jgi:hypothetical protein
VAPRSGVGFSQAIRLRLAMSTLMWSRRQIPSDPIAEDIGLRRGQANGSRIAAARGSERSPCRWHPGLNQSQRRRPTEALPGNHASTESLTTYDSGSPASSPRPVSSTPFV